MKEKPLSDKKVQKEETANTITTDRPWYMDWVMNIWIFIPVIMYFSGIADYTLNIPYIDDYDAILKFINDYSEAPFGRKMAMLLSWHNEHKIVPARIIFATYYHLTGSIDFGTLKYIGAFQLVVIYVVLASFLRPMFGKLWGVAAIIAGFLIFDFSSYFNLMCTMAGVANYSVIMLFMLALYFYNSDKKSHLYWGAAMHALCIISNGNGIIGAIALVMFALLLKDKKKIITTIAVTAVFAGVYFGVDVAGFSDPRNQSANAVFNLSNSVMYFLNMSGAHFAFTGEDAIANAYIYGVIVLIALAVGFPLVRKWEISRAALPVLAVTLFVLGSMLTVAIFRAIEGNHFYTSRYLVYPHLLTGLAVILLAYKFWEKGNIKWGILGLGIIITLFAYGKNKEYGVSCMQMEERRLTALPYYYNLFGDQQKDFEFAKGVADTSCALDIYCLEQER